VAVTHLWWLAIPVWETTLKVWAFWWFSLTGSSGVVGLGWSTLLGVVLFVGREQGHWVWSVGVASVLAVVVRLLCRSAAFGHSSASHIFDGRLCCTCWASLHRQSEFGVFPVVRPPRLHRIWRPRGGLARAAYAHSRSLLPSGGAVSGLFTVCVLAWFLSRRPLALWGARCLLRFARLHPALFRSARHSGGHGGLALHSLGFGRPLCLRGGAA